MTIGVWNNLPKAYKNALKSYVENAEQESIVKMSTWQTTYSRVVDKQKITAEVRYVYRVTVCRKRKIHC